MRTMRFKTPDYWIIAAVLFVLAAVALKAREPQGRGVENTITSFKECKEAGGSIMESFPERCAIDDMTFTNNERLPDISKNEYIGQNEQAALEKARTANIPARVVERDGESIPVTMDYMPGRLNLSVQDGKVISVRVEGRED